MSTTDPERTTVGSQGGDGAVESTASPPEVESNPKSDAGSIEDYTCPVCMDLLIDPILTNCEHLFCTYCLANWFHLRGRKNCPTCRTVIDSLDVAAEVAQTVEELIEKNYTTEQTVERDDTKRTRNESQLMQNLGQHPLETLMSQQLHTAENNYEFDFPIFDFDDDTGLHSAQIDIEYSRESMINLYARAMFQSSTVDPESNDWSSEMTRIMHPNGTGSSSYRSSNTTALNEIMARLDDFEITLRESQMAYRYLMDGLTTLDPDGGQFSTVDQRLRSLGLFPQRGRLLAAFPSHDAASERNRMTPHHSDWYFIQRSRHQLEREFQEDWLHHQQRRNPAESRTRDDRRATCEIRHLIESNRSNDVATTESDLESHHRDYVSFPYLTERRGHRRPPRRRRHHRRSRHTAPTEYPLQSNHASFEHTFPTFDRSLFDTHYSGQSMYAAEHPYEQYSQASVRYSTTMLPETSVTGNGPNICMMHSDGSQTWVDVSQRLEHDNRFEVLSPHNHDRDRTGTTRQELFLGETEEDDEEDRNDALLRESSYQVEFVVHRQCCPHGNHHHGGTRS